LFVLVFAASCIDSAVGVLKILEGKLILKNNFSLGGKGVSSFLIFGLRVGLCKLRMCLQPECRVVLYVDSSPLSSNLRMLTFVDMDIKKKFGKQVKKFRLKKGLSQEALANQADLDRTYIPSIEKGDRNVSIIVIEKIAKALKVKIVELLDEIDEDVKVI
jgi:DNA-binding XRE family transcriptional regulator